MFKILNYFFIIKNNIGFLNCFFKFIWILLLYFYFIYKIYLSYKKLFKKPILIRYLVLFTINIYLLYEIILSIFLINDIKYFFQRNFLAHFIRI
jgi:hypothetical protein